MKLYDRIWIESAQISEYGRIFIKKEFNLSSKGPVVVCSIQELKELWDIATEYNESPHLTYDFQSFIKSKGINID